MIFILFRALGVLTFPACLCSARGVLHFLQDAVSDHDCSTSVEREGDTLSSDKTRRDSLLTCSPVSELAMQLEGQSELTSSSSNDSDDDLVAELPSSGMHGATAAVFGVTHELEM